MRILAVDDDPEFLQVLKEHLEESGHDVTTATNGVDALERLDKESFDFMFLDLMMPKMDGWSVAARIRAQKRLMDLPIVLLTGVSDKRWLGDGILAGANYYVRKDRVFEVIFNLMEDLTQKAEAEPSSDTQPPKSLKTGGHRRGNK